MADEETTNKVLETKIDGLAKLTDTQLGHVNETLKDLKILVNGFVTKTELEEVKKDFNLTIKRIEDGFAKHSADDVVSFGTLVDGQKEARDTLLRWGAIGAFVIVLLSFFSPVIFKYIFHT